VASWQVRSWTGALSLFAVGLAVAALILAALAFTHQQVSTTPTTQVSTTPTTQTTSANAGRVVVPDVVGLTVTAAVARLQATGLGLAIVTDQPANAVASGEVVSQTPVVGTMVSRGSTVTVTQSVGPNS